MAGDQGAPTGQLVRPARCQMRRFYCDIGTAKVRVAFHGPKGWRIEHVTVDHLAMPCQPVHPQEGESHCSIARMPLDANDTDSANVPLGFGTNVFAP